MPSSSLGLEERGLDHPLAEMSSEPSPLHAVDLSRHAIGLRIALEMAVIAVELDVEQRRASAAARSLDHLAGDLVDLEEVVAIDLPGRNAEALGPLDLAAADRPARSSRFGIAIILGDEDDRQVPDLRQIVALQDRALVGGTVPVEGHRHAAGLERLRRQRCPAGERTAGADDAIGAEHALGKVGDVHRAALASAHAVALAEDLLHHPVGSTPLAMQ